MKEITNNSRAHLLLIGILAFLLYCPSIGFDYAQDDAIVFTDNQFVTQGVKGIPSLFTKDTFYGFFKVEGKETLVQGGRYRPASLVTFAIEQSLWGQKAYMSHLINTLLYAILCLLLYVFTKEILSRTRFKEHHKVLALVISLLFTCHPIHSEVVANVKGRDEIMVGLFGILSMVILFTQKLNIKNYILAFLSILICYFSKEHALVFVLIIPLTVFFFYKNDEQRAKLFLGAGLLSLTSVLFLIARQGVLSGAIAEQSMELMNNPFLKYVDGTLMSFNSSEKWASIIFNLGKYIQLLVFPHPLTSDYYPYHFSIKSFNDFGVILSMILYAGGGVLAILGLLKRSAWAYGLIFYFGFLFLMSNIPFNIGTNISERFLFLPSFGFLFALVLLIKSLLGKRSASPIIIGLIGITCLLFSIKTISRSFVWKDNFTLLTTDVKTSNNSAKALHGAAGALSTKGAKIKNKEEQKTMLELSNNYLEKALTLHPRYSNAYLIMGNNYQYMNLYDKSIQSYNNLLKINPEHTQCLINMHIAYRDGGRYFGEKKNDLNAALSYLQQAYNLNPKDYETVRLLAVSNGMGGKKNEAIKYFEEAVKLRPNEAFAYYNLGNAYYINGDEESGQFNHNKAIQLDPSLQEKINK